MLVGDVTRVAGPSLDQLDRLGDDYAGLVVLALAEAARQMEIDSPGVEDLALVRDWWAIDVENRLLPALGVAFEVGAATIRVGLREATGLTAAAFTDVPPTSDAFAEQYLAQARNRLVGVGDELWSHAREELLEGLRAGESVPELTARVRKAAPDLTEPRAAQIARSEVLGAVNAGALEQVLASGATGTKQWIAADDERTRPEHDHADNQTVGLREKFVVGGFPADRPHDPALPPHLSVSCRCALSFSLDLPEPEPVTDGQVDESAPDEFDRTTSQQRDRSFLARVFEDGLAALVGWFKGRTAAAMMPEQEFAKGGDMTAVDEDHRDHVHAAFATAEQGAWEGVLVVEGTPTGDGRQFSSGALTWAELPLPLKWQEREAEGHSGAVIVGRIDSIEREGDRLVGRGVFDLDGEHGREAHRLVSGGYMRGVSIQPDDIGDADIEVVWGEGGEPEVLEIMATRPELVVFNAGRVRSATLCAEAAFVEAEVRLTGQPLLAAASLDDHRPPAEFFTRCTDPILTVTTPDGRTFQPALGARNGRVWGYAAHWKDCHIGYPGVCTSPPQEDDFAHYMVGEVLCAGGERVPVGQITINTGHASTVQAARTAAEHYDHTGAAVADVVVGADDLGIWFSGALRPGADEAALRAAGSVSGDWRRINGSLRLVAVLAVNVAGFQQVRARVASGVQTALVAAGQVVREEITEPDLSKVKQRIAASIKRDPRSRKAAVAARVGKGG